MGSWRDPLHRAHQPAFCAQTVVAFYGLSQYHHICNMIRKTTPKMLHEGLGDLSTVHGCISRIQKGIKKQQNNAVYLASFNCIFLQAIVKHLSKICF